MTYEKYKVPQLWKVWNSTYVGFDDLINEMSKMHDELTKNIPNYPPCNIKKHSDTKYSIELAIAGFSRSDIEIEFVDDKLIVKGSTKSDDTCEFLHRGIGARDFARTFSLNDSIEIKNASIVNGILQIILERFVPEHKKPKKISIDDTTSTKTKQFLSEER
jgi:molecular chaperone IbpA